MINIFSQNNLDVLKEVGFIEVDENLYKAEKLFVANSVMNWAYEGLASGKLTAENILNVISILVEFQKNNINIKWVDGELHFKENGKSK